MVEAAGIEPETNPEAESTKVGQNVSNLGQNRPQVGRGEGVAICPTCKGRTHPGQGGAKAGRGPSIAGAQRVDSAGNVDDELSVVAAAWPEVPPEGRRAILGAIRAFTTRGAKGLTHGT